MGQGQDQRLVSLNDSQGTVNVEGEEGGRATKWDRESWEEGIKELSNGGKAVVPMTSEIDALRPKSPFRPNQSNSTGSMPVSGVINPRFVSGNRTGFVGVPQGMQTMGQNPMIVQPIMGMGMNPMGMGMGTGVDDMLNAWNPMMGGMGNMNSPAMGMNVGGMSSMNTASMGNVGRMGMPMMGVTAGGGGFGAGTGMFNAGMAGVGMGWGDQGQFGMEGGWDGDAMMAAGVGGMGSDMNMALNMNGGMGLGQWGAGPGTFEGFH